jgi:hypothetical protein
VIKDGDLFLLVEPDGRVPRTSGHGLGLYFQDCRYLRTYEVTLAGVRPVPLGSSSAPGHAVRFELTNPELALADGSTVPKEVLGIRFSRVGRDPRKRSLVPRGRTGIEVIVVPEAHQEETEGVTPDG